MKKILEIDSCFDCPHHESFGYESQCSELGRMLRSKTRKIPRDCPLPSAKNIIIVEQKPKRKRK